MHPFARRRRERTMRTMIGAETPKYGCLCKPRDILAINSSYIVRKYNNQRLQKKWI
jgi:hypothetical protein